MVRALLLILMTCGALSAQHMINDSIACYTRSELIRIATVMTRAHECDTLLSICELSSSNKDLIITNDSLQLINLRQAMSLQDTIILGEKQQVRLLTKQLNKTRLYWYVSSGLLLSIILFKL